MTTKQLIQLLCLAAIWGGSFIFMRVLAPVFGPIWTASMRLFIAGVFLLGLYRVQRYKLNWKRDIKHFILIGIINSSIPFFFYAYAALHIPASLSVILNAMAPMFGAIFAAMFALEKLTIRKGIGLLTGFSGVAVISISGLALEGDNVPFAIAACLGATICYGLSGVYVKLKAGHIPPKDIACGSQLMAGIALMPLSVYFPVMGEITIMHLILLTVFAILCSALAYLIYYNLIVEVGPTKTLTVTYLMPVFGILWGAMLLGESLTSKMALGGLMILAGTMIVTNVKFSTRRKSITAEK